MNDTFIIMDLEATCCDERRIPRDEMEIIEIGAAAIDATTGGIISTYESLVRPVRHRVLSTFCMALTGIQQEEADAARPFTEVLPEFAGWLAQVRPAPAAWGSWGKYDHNQFAGDCQFHGLPNPLPGRHRDLKMEFGEALGSGERMGVESALQLLGAEFEGRHHRALDDSLNIARIYRWLIGVWPYVRGLVSGEVHAKAQSRKGRKDVNIEARRGGGDGFTQSSQRPQSKELHDLSS